MSLNLQFEKHCFEGVDGLWLCFFILDPTSHASVQNEPVSLGRYQRNNHLKSRGQKIKITSDFSSETRKQEESGVKHLKCWQEINTNLEFYTPKTLSFKSEEEIKYYQKKNPEEIGYQYTCFARSFKINSSEGNNIGQKLRSAKERKSIGKGTSEDFG